MQIDITSLSNTNLFTFSHSQAEGGQDAGSNTWKAACQDAKNRRPPLLSTPEAIEAFKDFVQDSGGWTREEIDSWSVEECNALFIQWVAGDVRECPAILEGVTIYQREGEGWFFDHESTPDEETGPFGSRSDAYRAACDEHHGYHQTPRANSIDEIDWLEYEHEASNGQIPSNIYRADGRIFFSLQH